MVRQGCTRLRITAQDSDGDSHHYLCDSRVGLGLPHRPASDKVPGCLARPGIAGRELVGGLRRQESARITPP